jgi:hypothetical protein
MVHQRGGGRRERTGEGKDELVRRAQGEQANGGGGSTDRRIGGSRSSRERERERRERARLRLRARGANELGFGGALRRGRAIIYGDGARPLGPPCRWPCRPVGRAVPVPCLVPGRRPRHGTGYGPCRHGHGGGRAVRPMGRAERPCHGPCRRVVGRMAIYSLFRTWEKILSMCSSYKISKRFL